MPVERLAPRSSSMKLSAASQSAATPADASLNSRIAGRKRNLAASEPAILRALPTRRRVARRYRRKRPRRSRYSPNVARRHAKAARSTAALTKLKVISAKATACLCVKCGNVTIKINNTNYSVAAEAHQSLPRSAPPYFCMRLVTAAAIKLSDPLLIWQRHPQIAIARVAISSKCVSPGHHRRDAAGEAGEGNESA